MNPARVAAIALALGAAPSAARAQSTPPPLSPWSGAELPPPPPPIAAPPPIADPPPISDPPTQRFDLSGAPDDRPTRGARVGYEILGGFGGAIAGSLMTVGGACVLVPRQCPESGSDRGEFAILSSVTNMFAIPLGVAIAGNLAGGDGGFGWTFLGSLSGMTVALLPAAFVAASGGSSTRTARYITIGAFLTLLPMAGSIIAYEVSVPSRARPRRFEREARVFPTVDVSAQGATAGATIVF